MKTKFIIQRDTNCPPRPSKELATFCWMLQQPTARDILKRFGITLPGTFELIDNTNPDDPPDLEAFGYGFEITEFPPNLSAIRAIYEQRGGKAMSIPPLYRTGRKFSSIKQEIENPHSSTNSLVTGGFHNVADEIAYLEKEFTTILVGPDAKDIFGNDVLLVDQRSSFFTDAVGAAIRQATSKNLPKYIKLIIMVGNRESVQSFP